jgi:two-component system CheB/CheR fusion protein
MVVDDQEDAAEMFAELLALQGHEPLAVKDGPAALDAARTFKPDIVLLDIGLPGMDGYEVARKLRAEHGDGELLLVAVTGYQSDGARLKEAGFDHHLLKPLDLKKLSALFAFHDGSVGGSADRSLTSGIDNAHVQEPGS